MTMVANMNDDRDLVLIPGLACTDALFARQIEALSTAIRCHVAEVCADDIGAMAWAVLAAAPPRFALCGFSLGGYVALEVMRQAPERVSRLALLDTAAGSERPEQSARRQHLIGLARNGGFAAARDRMLPLLLGVAAMRDQAIVATVAAMFAATGPELFVRQLKAIMGRRDARPALSAIACPTLVLVGADDALTPVAAAREITRGIPAARLVVIDDCGHLSTLERPHAVSAALAQWLEIDLPDQDTLCI